MRIRGGGRQPCGLARRRGPVALNGEEETSLGVIHPLFASVHGNHARGVVVPTLRRKSLTRVILAVTSLGVKEVESITRRAPLLSYLRSHRSLKGLATGRFEDSCCDI